MAKTKRTEKSSLSAKEIKAEIKGLVEKGLRQAHKKIDALEKMLGKLSAPKKAKPAKAKIKQQPKRGKMGKKAKAQKALAKNSNN